MPCNAKGNVVPSEWLPSGHVREDASVSGCNGLWFSHKPCKVAIGRSHPWSLVPLLVRH